MKYIMLYTTIQEKTFLLDENKIKNKYYDWLEENSNDTIENFQDFLLENYLKINFSEITIESDNITEIYKQIKK